MNENLHSDTAQASQLDGYVAAWPQLTCGIHYHALVDYHSYNAYGTYNLSNEEWDNREMIFNFKNNSELTDPISHRNAMEKAIDLFTDLLQSTFGDQLPALTLVCNPASTAAKTAARFEEFAQIVTASTGMANGYDHVHIVVDQDPEHLGDSHLPQYSFDPEYFKGRHVLLFDDIMATGSSVCKFAAHIAEAGAIVTAAVVLGKTIVKPAQPEE